MSYKRNYIFNQMADRRQDYLSRISDTPYDESKFIKLNRVNLINCSCSTGPIQKYRFPYSGNTFIKDLKINNSSNIKSIQFCREYVQLFKTNHLDKIQQIFLVDKFTIPCLIQYTPLLYDMNIVIEFKDSNVETELYCDYYSYSAPESYFDSIFYYRSKLDSCLLLKYNEIDEYYCPIVQTKKYYFCRDFDEIYLVGNYICPPDKSIYITESILKLNHSSIHHDSSQPYIEISCTKPEMVYVICLRKNVLIFKAGLVVQRFSS
jgi:hypothetical protein